MTAPRLKLPLRLFISYSHKDDKLRERFVVHLAQLKRQGMIDAWHDRRITAGDNWAGQIDEHLDSAGITFFLVSADFLASDYCNDVEMQRAIERSRKGETRVIPVILEPCDWKASPLAEFEALPKDGKPVVDWPTAEHGLDDAVQGLRRLIVELCGAEPVQAHVRLTTARRRQRRLAAGLFVVAMLLIVWRGLSAGELYLRQGADLLNVGRYSDARVLLQRAKRWNPFSSTAACGLKAVELDGIRPDKVGFEQSLAAARQQYPHCAYLEVLAGDEKYSLGDRQGALAEYQSAVKREPKLAEAYFDIGRIHYLEGSPDAALEDYKMAAQISPATPRYANNLANLYFRREEYDKAIEVYGSIDRFPLAALEIAKIYRLQNKLPDAEGRGQDAVDWLKDQKIREAESQNAWAFDSSPIQQVQLPLISEKECYADLELAVTQYLKAGRNEPLKAISSALDQCSPRQEELKAILSWELRRLGNQTPELAPRSDEIAKLLRP